MEYESDIEQEVIELVQKKSENILKYEKNYN